MDDEPRSPHPPVPGGQEGAPRDESGRDYRVLIDHSPDAICVHDGRHIVFMNPAGLRLLGATEARQVVGHRLAEFVHQGSISVMQERIESLTQIGMVSQPADLVLRRLGGRLVDVEAVAVLTMWHGGRAHQVVLRDLTAQRTAEAAARRAELRFTRVVSTLVEGVVVIGPSGAVESMNPASAEILGVAGMDFSGLSLRDISLVGTVIDTHGRPLGPNDFPHGRTRQTGEPADFVVGLQRPGQSTVWIAGTCQLLDTAIDSPMVVSFSDVTAAREVSEQLEYQATHDSLTDLPNRLHVVNAVDAAIDNSARTAAIAILFLDLDNFKAINDSLGHTVGDEILRVAAARVRSSVCPDSLVGRVGGDEFVAVLLSDADRVDSVAAHMHTLLATPFEHAGRTITISVSIGVVIVPVGDTRTINDLLRDADTAMYRAKSAGGNRTEHFGPSAAGATEPDC